MGNPFDQFDSTPSGARYGAPPKVDPYAEEDQRIQREAAERASADQRRQDDAARRTALEWNATHNPDGTPKVSAKGPDQKLAAKRASLESLVSQINRVDELYNNGLKDEAFGLFSSLSDYLPTEENRQFDAAAAGLAEQGLAAFRVPGVGAQSDTELRQFTQANKPAASDYDSTIEEKLRQLRTRVDATREQLGMPAARWGAPKRAVMPDNGVSYEAATDYKRTDDPALSGLKGEYLNRLQSGQPTAQILKWMKDAGVKVTSSLAKSVAEQARFRKANPDVPVAQYNIDQLDDVFTPTTNYQRIMGAAAQNPFGAAAMAAGNAVSGGYLPDIVGATGGNEEQARIALNDADNQHPWATMAGGLAGGVTAALGGEAALGGAGMGAGFGRSLLADTGYGAFAGSGANPDDRMGGATWGAAAGSLGSTVGQGLARGGARVLGGVTNPHVNRLAGEDINMTLGSVVSQSGLTGRIVKAAEDGLTSIPGVGDMVATRKIEGIRQFNAKAFDRALEPIGAKVGDAVGEAAIEKAHQAIKMAFGDALKGKQAVPDEGFVKGARGPLERLSRIKRDHMGEEIVGQIEEATQDLFDPATGALSGENMQSFLEALRQIKQSYKSDPLFQGVIKPSMDGLTNAVEGMFARQAPEVMPKFNAAKAAYRRLSVMSDAVLRASEADGVFMPSQLGQAAKANSKKFDGPIAAAGGNRPFFDFQRAGQNVLPSKMPDSGTARRIAQIAGVGILPGAGAAGSYATGADPATGAGVGLGLVGVLGLLYTRAGQQRLSAMLLNRSPRARKIAEEMRKRSSITGASGAALLAGPEQ